MMDSCISSISSPRQKLVRVMQRNPYCRIELNVRKGEPSFNPPARITREIKLGREILPPTEADFVLKRVVLDLLDQFEKLGDGSVIIEVRHGLPVRLIVPIEV